MRRQILVAVEEASEAHQHLNEEFLQHLLRLENITYLSEAPCFGSRLEFFKKTKLGIEVKSQLVLWIVVRLREHFKFLIAIRTLMFCRMFAKLEDLCVVHVVE